MVYLTIVRTYSNRTAMTKCSKVIRREFLDYFKHLDHTVVRSSPVTPLNDPSVAFVNAGMNQFKGVFLGYHEPPAPKVVNSQKCIRIGGKHNDLTEVGNDSYHHTFFEMLGNWSFGNYFKKEACQYALELLTGPYAINKQHIYVTYFGGNEKLGLKPDIECKEIWLSLGIAEDKILPFGMDHNFWEMGLSGPCGPCTEIHIDHKGLSTNQSDRVNKGYSDLTELWNVVFVQYERLPNGSILPLDKYHVDTGMGFERLVALLQGKDSNYDTDLFQPLFKAIQKYSKAPEYGGKFGKDDVNGIDYGYRILADHARMVSISLADGILPDENYKLRRILRRAIHIGENTFKSKEIMPELVSNVADNLGDVYPELQSNLKQMQKVIQYEEDLLNRLRDSCGKEWKKLVAARPELSVITDWTASGLVAGYQDLQSMLGNLRASKILPGKVAFRLYDTYGLNVETIAELAQIESLSFDEADFYKELEDARHRSKVGTAIEFSLPKESLEIFERNNIPKTDDSFKYNYISDTTGYEFPSMRSTIIGVLLNGKLLLKGESIHINKVVNTKSQVGLILDKTPCYSTEGGQVFDKANISIQNYDFNTESIIKINGYVVHFGHFVINSLIKPGHVLEVGNDCTVSIDSQSRLGAMKHHTATHLLNAALKKVMCAAYQRGSVVSTDYLKFVFNSFGEKLTLESMTAIEKLINDVISANVPVTTNVVNFSKFLAEDNVTLVPGEAYPYDGIRLVEMGTDDLRSKEACCGTHVFNTKDLEYFCFLSKTSKGATNCTVTAATGPLAKSARCIGENIQREISAIEMDLKVGNLGDGSFDLRIDALRKRLTNKTAEVMPYLIREESLIKLESLDKLIWSQKKELEKKVVMTELQNAINTSEYPFLAHCLQQETKCLSLNEITSLHRDIPILIIMYESGTVKAQCSIPQEMVTNEFQAQNWMKPVLHVFDGKYAQVRNSKPQLAANMKSKKISSNTFASLAEKAIADATRFAKMHVRTPPVDEKIKQ